MDIIESVRELLADDELVIRKFYDKFVARDPKIGDMFRDVDLDQQAVMLTSALTSVQLNYVGNMSAVTQFLAVLGRKHVALGAPKELYPVFGECLMETLAEFHGPEWTDSLRNEWQEAIDQAFTIMLETYDETQ